MAHVRNVSTGPRGAYLKGAYVEAEVNEVIEADDFAEEWFAVEKPGKPSKAAPAKAEPEAE